MKDEIAGLQAALRIIRNERACVESGMESLDVTTERRTLDRVEQMLRWRLDAAEGKHHRSAQAILDTFAKIRKDMTRGN